MISLLLVNYRSAALAAEAVRSAREASSEDLEVVIVDNSCDGAELERLQPLAGTLLDAGANIGYAGAINLARRSCSGRILIACNPDVVFARGAIDALVAAFSDRTVAVAGPALYWDEAHRWILPPADLLTAREKLGQALASRFDRFFRWRDRRRFTSRLRFWELRETTEVEVVSGAVMAIRATDFDAAGGFDDSFRLYFEEIDFQRRLAARGRKIRYVPGAACRHLYNQSAGAEAERAAALYAESEQRYLAKWNGRLMAKLLERLERERSFGPVAALASPMQVAPSSMLEASPLRSFATASGYMGPAGEATVPPEVWRTYRGEVLYLREVERSSGRVRAIGARYRS